MIRFFRQIRQKLLTQNRVSRYLVYALGEILLVVIGILLALQVNTWNENRKNSRLRESYLENLMIDLKKDISGLEQLQQTNNTMGEETAYLRSFLDNSLAVIDTTRLTYSIFYSGLIPNITTISSTYNDLVNSNNLNLFQDVQLKRYLDDYYIDDNWGSLFQDRILKTAWYDYRDAMTQYHSPRLYQDFYDNDLTPPPMGSSHYDVKWEMIKKDSNIKTQVGMIAAYRILIKGNLDKRKGNAKTLLSYLEKIK